jgi:hypothetical protein
MELASRQTVPKDSCFRRRCRLIIVFGTVRSGKLQKKDVIKNAFEAGMCMKTNKSRTKYLEKILTFMS